MPGSVSESGNDGGLAASPKGGEHMPMTFTFHWRGFTVTVRVKRDNRHSGK